MHTRSIPAHSFARGLRLSLKRVLMCGHNANPRMRKSKLAPNP
jgi:hypothetical protein